MRQIEKVEANEKRSGRKVACLQRIKERERAKSWRKPWRGWKDKQPGLGVGQKLQG